jgi:hypothetical protein
MLARHNPADLEQIFRTTSPPPPFPPASDRAAWNEMRETLGQATVDELLAQAEEAASSPTPTLPATLWIDDARTGARGPYHDARFLRWTLLSSLVLGECLEGQGRYLDPLLDLAWAICEQSSWAAPGHLAKWTQSELPDVQHPEIDLGAAGTALNLAEMDALLGHALHPALRARIRHEVNRRCLVPFLERHDHWWMYNVSTRLYTVGNWNAVCNAGVTGAALYLEPDPARLAAILARALRSLEDYLASFGADGGTSEGPGYWTYGFGFYTLLAHLVEARTEGRVSLLEGELVRRIAQYSLRMQLSPGRYPAFADCDPGATVNPTPLVYLARRLDLPALEALAREQPPYRNHRCLHWGLRRLFWRPTGVSDSDTLSPPSYPPPSSWLGGLMVMVARAAPRAPDALVVAAKGGTNAEMHNHNDVGTLIVHLNRESLIADIGRGRYTAAYFSQPPNYPDVLARSSLGHSAYFSQPPNYPDVLARSSLGHSVPVPNGQAQVRGRGHGATLLEHGANDTRDWMSIEFKDAYLETADLASLQRTITLHREACPGTPHAWVELVDRVRFATRPGTLDSVLMTFGEAEVAPPVVVLRGERATLRVRYDTETVSPSVDQLGDVDLFEGPRDVRRVRFALSPPALEATIRLRIEPA